MSINCTPSLEILTAEKQIDLTNFDRLATVANAVVMNSLVFINDLNANISLIGKNAETRCLNENSDNLVDINQLQLIGMVNGDQDFLYSNAIELHSLYYYFAPIYSEDNRQIATIVMSVKETKSAILLALVHSIAREISTRLTCHCIEQKTDVVKTECEQFSHLNVHQVEKALIIEAALACGGKIQKMHQALNIGRTTLWRKLKQYDIDIKEYK